PPRIMHLPYCRPPTSTTFPSTTLFRSALEGRQDRHLEAQEGRAVARRQAVHSRRRRVQLGIRGRSRHRRRLDRHVQGHQGGGGGDRKSTRLNSSHGSISYAAFCSKKKI